DFFTEFERLDRFAEKQKREKTKKKIDYVSICSPNYLHDSHIRFALRIGANAICEKPLVLCPDDLDVISELEVRHGCRVYNILQLRLLEKLKQLREDINKSRPSHKRHVELTYITRRGAWYDVSWKGDQKKSGGPAMNIGVHFFDLLIWLFGDVEKTEVHLKEPRRMSGFIELEHAYVRWFLSVNETDLPQHARLAGKFAHRSMTLDGEEIEFSDGFTDLHTNAYKEILAGNGVGIQEAVPAIKLVDRINSMPVTDSKNIHPILSGGKASQQIPILRAAS
ncbi:MAG: Gfo/Idh/MocA family oxidoreductase, partial [Pirellulales bacterium]